MTNKLLKIGTLFVVSFILGFTINNLLFKKQKIIDKKEEPNSIEKISKKLPPSISDDLKKYLSTQKLTKETWKEFLDQHLNKHNNLSQENELFFQNGYIDLDKIKSLIDQGYDVNKNIKDRGVPPIFDYIRDMQYLDIDEFETLLELGFKLNKEQHEQNSSDELFHSDLISAALLNNNRETGVEILQYLESKGISMMNSDLIENLYTINYMGEDHKYKTKYLNKILSNLDPNTPMDMVDREDRDHRNVLQFVICENMKNEAIDIILEKHVVLNQSKDSTNVLHYASENDYISTKNYQRLIDLGADVNMQTMEKQETPLMIAVQYGQLEQVKILLENGADIYLLNNEEKIVFSYLKDITNKSKKAKMIELFKIWDEKND